MTFIWITHQNHEEKPNVAQKPKASMVEVDYKVLKDHLSDSCSLKGSTLKCSEQTMAQLLRGVDSSTVKSIGNNSVTFVKHGAYVSIPASVMANMIDLQLIKNETEQ
jgi:hypothetical protein